MYTKKNHEISLSTAVEMTKRYRAHKPEGFAQSEAFPKSAILKLLNTKDCVSLRIYYGMKENLEAHAILVAADEAGNDLLPADHNAVKKDGDDGHIILEDAWRCPPLCPDKPPLNG